MIVIRDVSEQWSLVNVTFKCQLVPWPVVFLTMLSQCGGQLLSTTVLVRAAMNSAQAQTTVPLQLQVFSVYFYLPARPAGCCPTDLGINAHNMPSGPKC